MNVMCFPLMCSEYESQVPCGISKDFLLQKIWDLSKNISQRNPQISFKNPKKSQKTRLYVDYHLIMHWKWHIMCFSINVFWVWVSSALRDLRYFSVAKKIETCPKIFLREIPSFLTKNQKTHKRHDLCWLSLDYALEMTCYVCFH